jgi:hypothetical protein
MCIELNQSNKQTVLDFWHALEHGNPNQIEDISNTYMVTDSVWHGPDPIGRLQDTQAFASDFWLPLIHSFPDLKRQTHVFFGGKSSGRIDGLLDGEMWVTGTGYFKGTFAQDYLTIPASGKQVNIRWGEFCRMKQGKIVETYFLLDLIDLMQQAGYEVLPPSRGTDGLYPPPHAGDGVLWSGFLEKGGLGLHRELGFC